MSDRWPHNIRHDPLLRVPTVLQYSGRQSIAQQPTFLYLLHRHKTVGRRRLNWIPNCHQTPPDRNSESILWIIFVAGLPWQIITMTEFIHHVRHHEWNHAVFAHNFFGWKHNIYLVVALFSEVSSAVAVRISKNCRWCFWSVDILGGTAGSPSPSASSTFNESPVKKTQQSL